MTGTARTTNVFTLAVDDSDWPIVVNTPLPWEAFCEVALVVASKLSQSSVVQAGDTPDGEAKAFPVYLWRRVSATEPAEVIPGEPAHAASEPHAAPEAILEVTGVMSDGDVDQALSQIRKILVENLVATGLVDRLP